MYKVKAWHFHATGGTLVVLTGS